MPVVARVSDELGLDGGGDGARQRGRGLVWGGKGAPPAHRDTIL